MAITYLSNIDLTNGELQNFKVQNLTSDPSVTGEGQLIYRTDTNVLKYYDGSNWQTIGTSGAGVTDFTNSNGTFVSFGTVNTGATGSVTVGSVDLSAGGTPSATTFLRGDNTWATPAGAYTSWTLAGDSGTSQAITDGNTATFAGGTKISTVASATDTLTINHATQSQTDTTSTASLPSGGSFEVPTVSVDSTGHVTGTDTKTITIGSYDNYSSWTLAADSGTSQTIASGNTATIAGTAPISTTASATDTVTITHDNSGVTADTYAYPSEVIVNATGHITSITAGSAPGTMSSWTLAGDSGTNQTISDGNTATFIGGTGITTSAANTDELRIDNSLPFNSITLAGSAGTDSTISNNGTITIIAGANISTTGNGSGGVTVAYTGGTGTMSSFTLAGDTGTSQTISDGDTLSILGSGTGANAGIDTVASATDTVTINLDLSEISTNTTITPSSFFLVGSDNAGANKKILASNIHLDQWGDAEADVDFGGNKLLDVATGTASTDGVNLGQVQSLIAGVGVFQGGYNASTNSPALSGGSNVALDTGDFYVVTTAGNAFFSTQLEPGDLIFANSDIPASSSPALSDYTVVIADQNIAGAGATDGATEKGVSGFDSANFNVSANGWVQLDDTGVSAGSYGGASKSLSATVTAKGLLTSLSEQNISITASQVSDFCSAVETCVASDLTYAANIGNGVATSYAVTHNLGTRDVIVQLYDNSSYDTVYAEVVRNTTNQVTITTNSPIATNDVRVLISKTV